MRKKLSLAVLLTMFSITIFAKHVDVATAKQVGQAFLFRPTKNTENPATGSLSLVYKSTPNSKMQSDLAPGTTFFYVFNNGTDGFVIIAGDDNVTPVLGYSNESYFNPNDIPENMKGWLESYNEQISYVIKNNIKATNKIKEEWKMLLNPSSNFTEKSNTAVVEPLITTKWAQSPYVNDLCPYDDSAKRRTVTGCVATAMAQIMKYWNHPEVGTGSYSYNHTKYGTLSANFGNTTYQWASMPNGVNFPNNAVATLMYHCGVSVEMNYGPDGSGANTLDVPNALKSYFRYSNSVSAKERSSYTDAQWIALLKSELNASRPVQYRGKTAENEGHSFVCDGYDNNDLFHINWGWGGMSDGYFQISNLNPDEQGTGGGSGGFFLDHKAVFGIQPSTSGTPVPAKAITCDATDIASMSATLNCAAIPGTNVISEKGFEWKKTVGGTYTNVVSTSAGNNFSANISGLTNNTSYTFRAYIKVGSSKIYGEEKTFTTVDANRYIEITVKQGSVIGLSIKGKVENTGINVVSGPYFKNITVGTDWTGFKDYEAHGSTMRIYGEVDGFNCGGNYTNVTGLDASKNIWITSVACYYNSITYLDFSKNRYLKHLSCFGNKFTTQALDDIYCSLRAWEETEDRAAIYPLWDNNDPGYDTVLKTNKNNAIAKYWKVRYLSNNTDIPATTGAFDCCSNTCLFHDNFESGSLKKWILADLDGDGWKWNPFPFPSYTHDGNYAAWSNSWSGEEALYPDNWMASPKIDGAKSIHYFVACDAAYRDHYAVMASPTNVIADFSVVFEETVPYSKQATEGVMDTSSLKNTRPITPWFERNITLPEGTKYVAFRHYNSDNRNYVAIDDVSIRGKSGSCCPSVSNLTATVNADNTVTLNWTNPPQSEWPNQCTTGNFTFMFSDGANLLGLEDIDDLTSWTTPVLAGGNHTLVVELHYYTPNGGIICNGNALVSVTLNELCPPVSNLKATVNANNTVTLTWTNPPSSLWPSDCFGDLDFGIYDGNTIIDGSYDDDITSWTTPVLSEGSHSLGVEIGYFDINSNFICNSETIYVPVTIGEGSCPPVSNLTSKVDKYNVFLTWESPVDIIFLSENFENGISSSWTLVDADGDGKNWLYSSDEYSGSENAHSGTGFACSLSWSYNNPLTPDNYLISPLVEGAKNVRYYFAVDTQYPAEHYAVMAATTGNDISDFQIVFEESTNNAIKGDESNYLEKGIKNGTKNMSAWIKRDISLPVGTKYVAFRHYNCTDQDYFALDDITIYGEKNNYNYTYTVAKDGTEIATGLTNTNYTQSDLAAGTYNYCVKAVYDNCTSVQVCENATIIGIENIESSLFSAEIYPNPTKDLLNIKCDNEIKSIELYDVLSKMLINKTNVSSNEGVINVSSLNQGMYMLKLNTEKGSGIFKVVVE